MKTILPILIVLCIAVVFWTAWHGCNEPNRIVPSEDVELRKRIIELQGDVEHYQLELAYQKLQKDTVVKRYYSSRDIVRNTHTTDTVYRDICLTALNDCDSALKAVETIVSTQDSVISVQGQIMALNSVQISNCNRDRAELELQNSLITKKVKRQAVGIKVLGALAAIVGIIAIVK